MLAWIFAGVFVAYLLWILACIVKQLFKPMKYDVGFWDRTNYKAHSNAPTYYEGLK